MIETFIISVGYCNPKLFICFFPLLHLSPSETRGFSTHEEFNQFVTPADVLGTPEKKQSRSEGQSVKTDSHTPGETPRQGSVYLRWSGQRGTGQEVGRWDDSSNNKRGSAT